MGHSLDHKSEDVQDLDHHPVIQVRLLIQTNLITPNSLCVFFCGKEVKDKLKETEGGTEVMMFCSNF